MPTSDAANTYAEARCCNLTQSVRRGENCKSSGTRESLAAAFDAGCAHALATVTPRTISTSAELDALPIGSIVTDGDRDAWQKNRDEEWVMVGCEGAYSSRHVFSDAKLKHPVTLLVPATAAPEPVCICGTPGLDYDGPDEECPTHGRTLEAIARALNTTVSAFLSPDERAEASRMLVGVSVTAAAPEPVRLLDPDDPRIRVGALVSYVTSPGQDEGESITFVKRMTAKADQFGPTRTVKWNRDAIRLGAEMYLMAEAPDPDAELVGVLRGVLENSWHSSQVLVDLRRIGYDITKRADS